MEFFLAIKRNEVRSPARKWMLLEVMVLCQLYASLKKTDTTHFLSFMGLILYRYIIYTEKGGKWEKAGHKWVSR